MATPASIAPSPVVGATDAITATVTVTTTVTEIAHTLVDRQVTPNYLTGLTDLTELPYSISKAASMVAAAVSSMGSTVSYEIYRVRTTMIEYQSTAANNSTGQVIEGGVLIALVAILGISFLIVLAIIAVRLGRLVKNSSSPTSHYPHMSQMGQPNAAMGTGQGYAATPNSTTPKEYATTTAHDYSTTPLLNQQQPHSQPFHVQQHASPPTQQQFTTPASDQHQFTTTETRA